MDSLPLDNNQELLADEEVIEFDDQDDTTTLRYSITSYGADYPVDMLVKRLDSGAILVPPFQRKYVWTARIASRFIESLLLGLPVPGIFLAREEDSNRMLVVDGQQRLLTLQAFYHGSFPNSSKSFALDLSSPGIANHLHGATYTTLSEEDRRLLDDSIIHATVIRQDEPDDGQSSIYNIFERLNTGGVKLDPQEIRASIYHGSFSQLLSELNTNDDWRFIYGAPSPRMRDQELILRFFALYFNRSTYERPMKGFLNSYMDTNRNIAEHSSKEFEELFGSTIGTVRHYLGRKAFRPKSAINAAVYDGVMIGVATRLRVGPISEEFDLEQKHAELLADPRFVNATTRSTADKDQVISRIETAIGYFAGVR